MKIKLIAPGNRISNFWDMKTAARLINKKYGGAPLALPTIAAFTPKDIQINIVDENIEPISFSEQVDLVGVTFNTPLAIRAYEIATEFKNRGVTVIAGGMHASALPEEALKYVDSVVIGEAENIWLDILNDFKCGELKKIYTSEIKPDLQECFIPRWDLTKYKYYNYFTVQTSRGCPFNCEFCSVKVFFGDKIRFKPIDNIINEIKFLQSLDPYKQFIFADDNITANFSRAKQLFEALIPLKIRSWWGQAPISIYKDKELLDLMYKSGCRQLLIGLESITQKNLELMDKDKINKIDEYCIALRKIYDAGIAVSAGFILGNDFDDEKVFKKIYDFVMDIPIALPQLTILTPLPGTRLYNRLEQENRIFDRNWSNYNFDKVCFKPKGMSSDYLQNGYYWLIQKLYSYVALYKRLDALWNKGVLVRDRNKKAKMFTRGRIFLTFKILLFSLDIPRIIFAMRTLWHKKCTSITSFLMSLSIHDYAYNLPRHKPNKIM